MGSWILLLTTIFVVPSCEVSAKSSYVVLVPYEVRRGLVTSVYVHILRGSGVQHINVSLYDDNGNNLSTSMGTIQIPGTGNIPLWIPNNITLSSRHRILVKGNGRAGIKFHRTATVSVNTKSSSLLIQTDKATYGRGQEVQFRTFGIYPNLKPVLEKMNITIYDSKKNKLKQWLNVLPPFGVFQGSIKLTKFTNFGNWWIGVKQLNQLEVKYFKVEDYILPKFSVKLKLPSMLSGDKYFTGSISAMYTFGKPVKGMVKLRIERVYKKYVTKTFPISGTITFKLLMSEIGVSPQYFYNKNVEASVTENITGISRASRTTIYIQPYRYKLWFLPSRSNYYKPGLPYETKLFVTKYDGSPLREQNGYVNITVSYMADAWIKYLKYPPRLYTIPTDGVVTVKLNTGAFKIPKDAERVYITAKYKDRSAGLSLSRTYSLRKSYVQIQLLTTKPKAGKSTFFRIKSSRKIREFHYQVISKGSILQVGTIKMDVSRRSRWFCLILDRQTAPRAMMLVYYVYKDEIVADSIVFGVDGVFENKVAIEFKNKKSQPGESNALILKSDPGSLVNVLAVDKSVQLLRSGNDITRNDVLKQLHYFNSGNIPSSSSREWWYAVGTGGKDTADTFIDARFYVLTDAVVYKRIFTTPTIATSLASSFWATTELEGTTSPSPSNPATATPPSKLTTKTRQPTDSTKTEAKKPMKTRKFFPETLLFQGTLVGRNGKVSIPFTTPDQMTTFVASAFTMNLESGFSVTEIIANFTVFQNFFIRINPTPSAIRGEIVIKQIDIFNYGDYDEKVIVEMKKGQFSFADMHGNLFSPSPLGDSWTKRVFVKKGAVTPVFFPIVPDVIGKIKINVKARSKHASDAITKEMDVKPEGIEKMYYISIINDLKNANKQTRIVDITFPPNLVRGSEYIKITNIGDQMGSTIAGLEDLLRTSYGCGEQNMLNFAPNVFVINYLKITLQLTMDIELRAKSILQAGYLRELGYQHFDGSFSAFGNSDRFGSTWLTSFVLKCFVQAKDALFIDKKVITDAVLWIIRQQRLDGSFNEPGNVIHKAMQGGSIANRRSLTAFVVIALQETLDRGFIQKGPITTSISKAADFIALGMPSDIKTLYELAIASYALTLTKHIKARDALAILETKAITKGDFKYWKIPSDQASSIQPYKSWRPPGEQVRALDIEVTAYVLLTYVRISKTASGSKVLKWLAAQRNDRGGFISTQDTVLAIQAFSEFAGLVFSPTVNIASTVQSEGKGNFKKTFVINSTNALILQQAEVPRTVRELNITSVGHGISLTEVAVFFNVEEDLLEPAFFLNVSLSDENINGFNIRICFSLLREQVITMALLQIGIPTGMEGDVESLSRIPEIKRVEEGYRKIDVYLEELTKKVRCTSMDVNRVDWIARHKAVPVVLFDYYQPTNQITEFYVSKVLSNSTIIEVCQNNGCMDVRVGN